MITVHMIGNAHIDPVWLWRWPAGVGEVLSTCRTACDILDEDPRLVFTRSDVWVYQQVEEIDTGLFERIRAHVAAGRWAVVGGWYVQPDCNFPREESFLRHIESGRRYFSEKLGTTVTVGYNVDSFGHAASLPRILADNGYDSYVMMRPMAHEKALSADLFRWRSTEEAGGVREVLTWRIARAYCISEEDLSAQVEACLRSALPGVDHVMCFYGVGDHGGGPTRAQAAWIRSHQDSFPGARLVFSHPRAFFDAVKPHGERIPVVTGELQMHAVGCYSVGRALKKAVRQAEHRLLMAETSLAALGTADDRHAGDALRGAWEKVLFNQFHDTCGGTALPEAFDDAMAQLGGARDTAEKALIRALYCHASGLPGRPDQRIVAFNASDTPFDGFIEWEPWLGDWKSFAGGLADEEGRPVPFQLLPSPSAANMPGTLLWQSRIEPGRIRTFSIVRGDGSAEETPTADLGESGEGIQSGRWRLARADAPGLLAIRHRSSGTPLTGADGLRLCVFDDPSDTWSHGIDRYAGRLLGTFSPVAWHVEETGPVRASLRVEARFNESTLVLWARLYRGDPRIELVLRVEWREKLRVAKLVLPVSGAVTGRLDGIPGGGSRRGPDGREYPLMDWTIAYGSDGHSLGVASPDCSALDGSPESLRFTLLRSPVYAWHDPAKLSPARVYRFTDQGEHEFRFALLYEAQPAAVNALALAYHRPPVCVDWTRGVTPAQGSS